VGCPFCALPARRGRAGRGLLTSHFSPLTDESRNPFPHILHLILEFRVGVAPQFHEVVVVLNGFFSIAAFLV
jgi:hypothetical protein